MKLKQKISIFYLFIALFCGFLSSFIKNVLLAIVLPLVIYFASSFFILKKRKKKNEIFINSLILFLLIWLVTWILIYNL